jgi:hypothetical protein
MKERKLSQRSTQELVEAQRHRYLQASWVEKTRILDELVVVTGFHRKHAIRILRHGYKLGRDRQGRRRVYTGSVVTALVEAWRISENICGKRLQLYCALHQRGRVLGFSWKHLTPPAPCAPDWLRQRVSESSP